MRIFRIQMRAGLIGLLLGAGVVGIPDSRAADEELDYAEDAYLRKVASGLGIETEDISSLALDISEVDDMDGILAD